MWFKNFISCLRVVDNIIKPLKLYCNNKVVVFFSHNDKLSEATKHIDIKYLVMRVRKCLPIR
jgi:hypothetical protein